MPEPEPDRRAHDRADRRARAQAEPEQHPPKDDLLGERGLERDPHERLERGLGSPRSRDLLVGQQPTGLRDGNRDADTRPRSATRPRAPALTPPRRARGLQPEVSEPEPGGPRPRPTSAAAAAHVGRRAGLCRPMCRCEIDVVERDRSDRQPARSRADAGACSRSRRAAGSELRCPTSLRTPLRATVRKIWSSRSSGLRPASRSSCINRWSTVAARPLPTTPCVFIHWLCRLSRASSQAPIVRELVGRRVEPEHRVEERQQIGAVVVAGRREHTGHDVGRVLHVDEHLEERRCVGVQRMPFGTVAPAGRGVAEPFRRLDRRARARTRPTPSL